VSKKWYSYFIVTDEPQAVETAAGSTLPAAKRVADVVSDAEDDPGPTGTPSVPRDFSTVYESAKIAPAPHGYTVLKVADMLESEHLQTLAPEVKRKSILVALDAAGVSVETIIEDAVRRDRALDTYERVLEKHLNALRIQTETENKRLEDDVSRQLADLRERMAANTRKLEHEEREFLAWRERKQQEESVIARTVGHFVTENPITAGSEPRPARGDSDVR
jgi:hypothetical protein